MIVDSMHAGCGSEAQVGSLSGEDGPDEVRRQGYQEILHQNPNSQSGMSQPQK